MGRTSDARDRLLNAACELMHSRGYTALGVAEICARADVRKGSFYHFFASKQALTVEAVTVYWQRQRAGLEATLAAAPPEDRLERLVAALTDPQRLSWQATGRVDGCLLGNLAVELSNHEPEVQRRLAEIFDEQFDIVRSALPAGVDPAVARSVARSVVAHVEGTVLIAKLAGDITVLDGLWPQIRGLVPPIAV